MTSNQLLRRLVEDVKNTGEERTLKKDEAGEFYNEFQREMSPVVEEIREREKRAHEEAQKITLA